VIAMNLPARAAPNTFEYIEAIAMHDPRRPALVQDHQGWTYAEVFLDLVRVVHVLHELGVKRGDRVAVGMSGFQANLLLLFAAESLGAVTVSFLDRGDPDAGAVFALVDWVFSDAAQDVPAPARFVAVGDSFLKGVSDAHAERARGLARVALDAGEPQRISRTSGSTGRSKFMVHTRFAQEYWIEGVARTGRLTADSRVLLVGPFVLNGHFARAAWCLRMGASVLSLAPANVRGHDITHVCALPLVLDDFVRSLPPGPVSRRPVLAFTTGGAVSRSLRERAHRALGGPVTSRYGMNEVGSICDDMDENGVGVLSPGLDLRIVDEQGRDVPMGTPGRIVVRAPALTDGYLGDAESTRAAFRDGWFHSGDWGVLVGPRRLRLFGRHDDLVNAGGLKVPAAQVEADLRRILQPDDCAVLACNLDNGATTMGIAIVAGPNASREESRRMIGEELHLAANVGARVIFLDSLPRMGNGKVDRVALLRLIESPPAGAT
jgi:acyl-coenzyme A synthetase/AMP-(fatty) acid ligase